MKKFIKIIICFLIIVSSSLVINTKYIEAEKVDEDIQLSTEAAVLIDATSGAVLYEKNATMQMFPASTTKVMTALLAIEHGNLDDVITVSNDAVNNIDRSSSHIYLDYGEQFTLEQGLYALLLQSSNDVAYAIAEHIGGTYDNFIVMMNDKAKAIGAMNTNFVNPHGLPDDNHYTTAYDLALILKEAIRFEDFVTISSTVRYEMAPTNKQDDIRYFANSNEHIKSGKFEYENAVLGKTGYTKVAGYSFVEYAKSDDLKLIVVTMNSQDSDIRFEESKKILDYGFSNYKEVLIEASKTLPKEVEIKKGRNLEALVTFSMSDDFYMLADIDEDTSNIELVIEVFEENDKDLIGANLVMYSNNVKIGEVLMDKEIEVYDISFAATTLPIILNVIDGMTVIVMAGFVFLFVTLLSIAKKKKRI